MALNITYKLLTTWTDVELLWPQVFAELHQPTIFQELSVQRAWWLSAGEPQLKIVVVFEDETPIAIFPFCQKETRLQLMGDEDVTDYQDVIVPAEKTAAAFEGLRQFLTSDETWQTLQLISLPESSSSFAAFEELAQNEDWKYQRTQQTACPIIELPATWEEYLANLPKKQRHEITRKWRKLEEQGKVTFRLVTDTNADPKALETFFTLHAQSSIEKDQFWTAEHRRFFEELSRAASEGGWLRLYLIDFDGEPAATMYCFEYGDDLEIYNSGFNAARFAGMSIGNVMASYTIKDAILRGKKRYDFLRGEEEFKLRYGATPHPIFNILVEKSAAA